VIEHRTIPQRARVSLCRGSIYHMSFDSQRGLSRRKGKWFPVIIAPCKCNSKMGRCHGFPMLQFPFKIGWHIIEENGAHVNTRLLFAIYQRRAQKIVHGSPSVREKIYSSSFRLRSRNGLNRGSFVSFSSKRDP
jgi:hypothetical protein